jgi:hypothetical protein
MVQTSRKHVRNEKAADRGKLSYQFRTRRNNLDIGLCHARSFIGSNSEDVPM